MSFIALLLLIGITWLLWQIHQDLRESNDRQRNLKTAMARLANQVEALLEQPNTGGSGAKTQAQHPAPSRSRRDKKDSGEAG